jgi:predicted restriction endonuclease
MRNYKDPQYIKWRKAVYTRDNFCCQWPNCNFRSKLNAHHIKKWSDYPGLRYNIDNGITLCYQHHKMIKNMETDYEYFFFKIIANKNG